MIEIRFHGRGGQGAVIGSEVLAYAFFIEGRYVQAFPAFGVERRGAPVTAFCRIDDQPINLRNQIYEPDHVVVLDSSLIKTVDVAQGLKKNGVILLNALPEKQRYTEQLGKANPIYVVNASAIAAEFKLGSPTSPIVNTAILGGLAKAIGAVKIESVEKAIEHYIPVKTEMNQKAARAAYERAVKIWPDR